MKKITKIGVLAVGAAMVTMGAQANQTPFELGFTSSTATSDIIIDLGTTASLLGQTTVVDLSSDLGGLSSFNSVFGGTPNGVGMGVVSGNSSAPQGQNIYATQVRGGGAGSSSAVAGTETIPSARSSTQVGTGASVLTSTPTLAWPSTAGASLTDTSKSYTSVVEANASTSLFGKSGLQVAGAITSGIVYEDLFLAKPSTALAYQGYFTFNYASDLLTFTSVNVPVSAVPEPVSYGAVAGLGLLLVSLRRQFVRKTA
jgi:hypothetical protein